MTQNNNTVMGKQSQINSFSLNTSSTITNRKKKLLLSVDEERVFYPGPLPTNITVINHEIIGVHAVPTHYSSSEIEQLLTQHSVLYFTGSSKRLFEKLVKELNSKYKIIKCDSKVENMILELQLNLEKENVEREIIVIDARNVMWKEAEDLIDALNTVFVNKNVFIYK